MKQYLACFLILLPFVSCQEPNDTRCSIYDSKCQKDYFQNVGRTFAYTGLPDVGIPIIDPFKLNNVQMSILGLLNLTLVDGEAEGIGKCIVRKFETHVESRYREPEVICDKIIIRGRYELSAAPVVGKTCGWCDVHGEGNGTITLENWFFKFKYPFKIMRHKDGQIYIKGIFDEAEYKSSVDNVIVEADSIKMGNSDITNSVVKFINNNWKLLMGSSVGKFINDKAAQYYYGVYGPFFEKVPANKYFKDDLSSLLDN